MPRWTNHGLDCLHPPRSKNQAAGRLDSWAVCFSRGAFRLRCHPKTPDAAIFDPKTCGRFCQHLLRLHRWLMCRNSLFYANWIVFQICFFFKFRLRTYIYPGAIAIILPGSPCGLIALRRVTFSWADWEEGEEWYIKEGLHCTSSSTPGNLLWILRQNALSL